jgi:hypothetical protein
MRYHQRSSSSDRCEFEHDLQRVQVRESDVVQGKAEPGLVDTRSRSLARAMFLATPGPHTVNFGPIVAR